jgi:hypothetical protein
MNTINYQDIYVVDTFEEAEQFRYEHDDQPVEVGTAVGHDVITKEGTVDLCCFKGIYFTQE